MGRNRNNNHSRGNCYNGQNDEVIVNPSQTVVNTTTNQRVVRNIHPTEIVNVNRTIIRNENYYPVTERTVEETVVENYDCGNNVNNSSNCRPFWNR